MVPLDAAYCVAHDTISAREIGSAIVTRGFQIRGFEVLGLPQHKAPRLDLLIVKTIGFRFEDIIPAD